jgi:lysophospholipase L1-like esterase
MRINPIVAILFLFLTRFTDIACQPLKILPLGNSLTKGVYCTNGSIEFCTTLSDSEIIGYRFALYNALNNAGFNFDFVGNEIAGYSILPDYNHAGYPGFTAADLAEKMNNDNNYLLNSTAPDIVLLEIGTNDVSGNVTSIEGVRSILNEIDEYETTAGKPVLVFLSKILQFAPGTLHEELVGTFNSNLYNLYTQRIASGDLIEWVDVGADIVYLKEPSGDMKDQLHPNQAGYDKMAQRWFNAIHGINTAPVASTIPNQFTTQGTNFAPVNLDNYIYDAEDADQYITWTVQVLPQNYTVTINSNRQAIVTPKNSGWKGSENVTFVATDRGNIIPALKRSAVLTVTYTVNALNHPPSINIPADRDTYVEDYFELKLTAADVDENDNPVITAKVLPEWLHFNAQTTTLYGIAGNQYVGNNPVKVSVNDQSISVDSNFVISVFPKSVLNDVVNDERIVVYPNPATQYITITCRDNAVQPIWFRLFSVTGVLMVSEWIQGEVVKLDLRQYDIPSGAYIYDISGPKNSVKGKLMINPQ